MSEKLKKYKVSIFGESYLLVTDESEELLATAAQLVDHSMREIAEKSQITESKRIAVLVALQFASKVLAAQEATTQYRVSSDKLLELVNRELAALGTP